MPVIPIMPSINTCMSLTTTTTTVSNTNTMKVPEVNATQLQALAEVCSSVNGNLFLLVDFHGTHRLSNSNLQFV